MLSGGELQALYAKSFVMVKAWPGHEYPLGHELRIINSRPYTPVMVFLGPDGRPVHRSIGFGNKREAKALAAYVDGRHYKTTPYAQFLAGFPDD